ncbi:MAG TPA: 3-phosphoshikimate 1-carboxyvinyltransferase [Myxococcota bacterium]|nr:3-phosphoshikimate 1-carboxyvinyltransferase [Myxococcota bacterium]HRY93223.1 3-phosphoshikimate 1-carboxyvinyltransferase [Myxococcota bacterium]HSA21014.1 3-phosphoshikimate 1-carboxyvinyltransferase [Myxococcota bacterium]
MRWVRPGKLGGRLRAPPSKSVTLRAVAAAALAEGTSSLLGPSTCDDARAALAAARALGAEVEERPGEWRLRGLAREPAAELTCGESGLCLRAFACLAALGPRPCLLRAEGSLRTRPVGPLEAPLQALGAACETAAGLPPVRVRGPLRGGRARVDGAHTSQLLTGLLLAAPRCPEDSLLEVTRLASAPYVRLTLEVLQAFGLALEAEAGLTRFRVPGGQRARAARLEVEGDWSGAAFPLVLGALAGPVAVDGLRPASAQADRAVLEALAAAGATPAFGPDGALGVERAALRPFEFDARDCPDLFPPLAALALGCPGTSRLIGLGRLRHKESDRAAALIEELGKLGGRLGAEGEALRIEGGRPLRAARIDPRGDHRIAMAAAVAAVALGQGAALEQPGCVAKSYPAFFDDLARLGAGVEEEA